MKTNLGLIAGLVVSLLLAAVFAVLWFGAYEDNNLLMNQVKYLTHQLEGNLSTLQKTAQQLAETQKQLQDTQNQLQDTQNQLEQTQNQLRDTQAQLSQAEAQLTLLEIQKNQLVNQLAQLNATYQQLRNKVYAGYDLVQQAKALLNEITLNAPQVDDVWTFTQTYTYIYNPLPSGYFYHVDLSLYSYQTIEVSTSEPLYIAFFTPDQYEAWRNGYGGTPLASGRGYVKFTPPSNGTYVLVIYNDLGRDVEFQVTYRYLETWHYYDGFPLNPVTPYVVGTPGTPSRDFFRLFAIYNYWLENRHQLADAVMRQLRATVSVTAFSPQQQLQLDTQTLYALSLAALLKNAGFDVSFAAIGTSWSDPFDADSIMPVVRFHSLINPNATFSDMFNKIERGWMHVKWLSRSSYVGYYFYVVIDTYNVVEAVDRQLSTTTPFNVIYVDGVTELP
jgi:HPt (histidine-containing phosphotransfer) domain-containing protein